ncbi:KIR protein [Plasmodium coatneyi]|uniref:KIR protein n=1 Tax=Plasmodium coatneyi TaxID=208452 RepID=A0A1B1DWB9_9APIC|nr:KIR protein [Plasmodium coatneyi]ANQ07086.1 KIR protein [Plasmodium coatneyi]
MADEDQFLRSLTSYSQFYETFDNVNIDNCSSKGTTSEQLGETLRGKLNGYPGLRGQEKKIMGAYCSACKKKREQSNDNTPCWFFYYWLGDKYWNDLKNHKFSDLLREIHTTLMGGNHDEECRIQYSDVNKKLLPQMKTIFDYFYEHEKINKQLLQNGLNCKDQLSPYVNKISSACITLREDCKGKEHISDSYCNDFNTKYKVHCNVAEALKLYCTEAATLGESSQHTSVKQKLEAEREIVQQKIELAKQAAQQEKQTTLFQLKEAESKASAATSLSSAFGTLAVIELPAALFFLYKVKL